METLTIEFQPNLKSKILELLSSFTAEQLKIVHNETDFEANKRKIEIAYAKLKSGTAKFYTVEEVDAILEETISKYEN